MKKEPNEILTRCAILGSNLSNNSLKSPDFLELSLSAKARVNLQKCNYSSKE